jgi:two-component system response regulator HydG
VDVRVIAATNRNLDQMVAEGTFREDLYYRLNVMILEVPPLRERKEDISLLARHFWEKFAGKNRRTLKGITPKAMDLLLRYHWPGNVRELENVMERCVILLRGEYITENELPLSIQRLDQNGLCSPENAGLAGQVQGCLTLAQMERQIILQSLSETGGNKSETARRLGITRRTLQLKLKKYDDDGIDL